MTLPPLRLTADERMYLAAELDIAADTYADAAGDTRDPDMLSDARRLRRFAERMRGAPRPHPEGRLVRLADLPVSE